MAGDRPSLGSGPVPQPNIPRAYVWMARIVRPFLGATTRHTWSGVENLPEGAFIAAANHTTNIDPLVTAHFLYDSGRPPRIMAKASLFSVPVLGWLLRHTDQIPVYRGTAQAGEALISAEAALDKDECVLVFPEGTLTRDPNLWPMVAKTGVGRLALTSRAPVVPIAQWGATDLLARYGKMIKPFPPKRVWVAAGPPVDLSDLYDRPADGATLREATRRIMEGITALLAEIRGEEPPPEAFDARRREAGGGRKP
jgi:1-acyl-sn-glycerol-3-phosphate acyltransferase